jgi:hypothetical protein
MAGIIWLASYPKSGNTWVRMFLENLLGESDDPIDINARKNYGTGDSLAIWYSRFTDKPIAILDRAAVDVLRPRVHQFLTTLSVGAVVIKTHNALIEENGVPLISPEYTAGAIYLVRNPLDVSLSSAHHFGITINRAIRSMANRRAATSTSAAQVYSVYSSWSEHVESWTATPHPGLLVVRYEDMLDEPDETFGRIARHVGKGEDPGAVARAHEHTQIDRQKGQESGKRFNEAVKGRSFFRDGRAEQWRTKLSRSQVQRIMRDHGATMARLGYIPEGY